MSCIFPTIHLYDNYLWTFFADGGQDLLIPISLLQRNCIPPFLLLSSLENFNQIFVSFKSSEHTLGLRVDELPREGEEAIDEVVRGGSGKKLWGMGGGGDILF